MGIITKGSRQFVNPYPTVNLLNDVVYGGDKFVSVGSNGTVLASSDGIEWRAQNSRTDALLLGITYGNNTFVAVGYGGLALISQDGISWTAINTGASLEAITYGSK